MKQAVYAIFGILIFYSTLYSTQSIAFSEFKVSEIQLRGLQGIAESTVLNYLPVKVGDSVDEDVSSNAIDTLFKTGFFNDITLKNENTILIVELVERPAIAKIKISGNDEISEDDLTGALKKIGLSEGRIFNRSLLDKVEQELQRQYFSLGKYGVKIQSKILDQERNRIALEIEIDEGQVTRIRKINIIGNSSFSDKVLLGEFNSEAHSEFSTFGSDSQYSKQKLFADIELLRSFYMDRGYLKFSIESTQVSISPDKNDVFVTININEGGKYTVSDVKLAGEFVVAEDELKTFVGLKSGDIFSRRLISESSNKINQRLGVDGYAFANVNPQPEVNEEDKTVSLTFFIDPGKRVYIRRVTFGGNVKTHDEVLRREMRQLEGGWYSTTKLERSKTRLFRTGFFEDVNVETPLVAGHTDMVDVVIHVTERPSGSVQASVGYGQGSGIILSASINQNNFLGTGKQVGAEISNNDVNTVYSFSMTDPYFTVDGISRSFRVYFRKTDAAAASSIAGYNSDVYGGSVGFGFPLSEYRRARIGLGFDDTVYRLSGNPPSLYSNFKESYGDNFKTITVNGSWSFDTRNRVVFADSGFHTVATSDVTLPGGDLQYMKLSLRQQIFWTAIKHWTIHLDGTGAFAHGYGSTESVPFYDYYYAGGAQSVRGFRSNSLGPQDNNDSLGGTKKLVGVAELLFPNPFSKDSNSVRLSAFVDAGNIWGADQKVDIADIRATYGFGFTWMAPIGALKFSWAWPLRTQVGDETERFQFSIGAPF
ncbi:MAG: outer membrane protein assembly factor BamA [Gammaproteobacteria bacterium]|nr:outer membrane protein assembly factor BamA [Gammaproteobacteria bacterium]